MQLKKIVLTRCISIQRSLILFLFFLLSILPAHAEASVCPVTIDSNFNGTSISQGNYIWFNGVISVSGRNTSQTTTIAVSNSTISFTANNQNYQLSVPNSRIVFSPTATSATMLFENGQWVTTLPATYTGNVFLSGLAMQVPTVGLPGGINPVKWASDFMADSPNLTIQWKWAAAVYTNFSTDYNALGIKVDDGSDHAGTPEYYKAYVIGGARGGGGSNFTGSYSGTLSTGTQNCVIPAAPPAISITSPANNSIINTGTMTVTGTVDDNTATVKVNGAAGFVSNNAFTATVTGLSEGVNTINATATNSAGNTTASIQVTLDTVPPVTAAVPAAGTYGPDLAVTLTANEAAKIYYTTDGATPTTNSAFYSGPMTIAATTTLQFFAVDLAGNSEAVKTTVYTIDANPPTGTITINNGAAYTNNPAVSLTLTCTDSISGCSQMAFSSDNQTWTPAEAFATAKAWQLTSGDGPKSVYVKYTNGVGSLSEAYTALITLDTTPPDITVNGPANNSYTNSAAVQVNGSLDDATASLTINDAPVPLNGQNFTYAVTLSDGLNSIRLAATDLASNPSSTTIYLTLDQSQPVVTITTPVSGSIVRTQTITVSGSANEALTSAIVNNTPAQVAGNTFTLASMTLSEGLNPITVQAYDRAGNPGTATASVTLDTQAPQVEIQAPAQAAAGTTVTLSLNASDANGLSLVEVTANGLSLWSVALNSEKSTQNSIAYSLSPDLAQGKIVDIQAKATDAVGNVGVSPAAHITISNGPTGPGYIQGEVYDDTKGLRLEGADVNIISATDGRGLTQITTGPDGGYFTEAGAGDYLISVSRAGYTSVERFVTVRPEKKSLAVDARLTPISSQQNLVDASGGTATADLAANGRESTRIELIIPANALSSQTDVRVTPVSNQGLAALLPAGWSPIAVVDIRDLPRMDTDVHGYMFAQAATLKMPVSASADISPSSPVTIVWYDTASHQWIVQAQGTVNADTITASIQSTGQYAFLLPDDGSCTADVAAAVPQCGQSPNSELVSGQSITAAGSVVPPAAPPSAGLKAVGEIVFSSAGGENGAGATMASGLIVNATVTERFDLFSGDSDVPSDYVQDLVLYRYPCLTNFNPQSAFRNPQSGEVGTTFPVTPSHEYSITELMLGKVGITVTLPEIEASGTLVGSAGGRTLDADGNVFVIPPGSLSQTVPVGTKTIAASSVSGIVGADFTLLRAVEVNLTRQLLSSSAELSTPVPQGLNASLPIVVAKSIDVHGLQKLKAVSLAKVSGSLITSSTNLVPSLATTLSGIVSSGTYFFLQAKSPLGFVKGTVTGVSGGPASSAFVTSSTCSLVDLTGVTGTYLTSSAVSFFSISATDLVKSDMSTGSRTISAANQVVDLDIAIKATPPRVILLSPADGSLTVEPKAPIVITFSEPIDKTTITSQNIILKETSGASIQGTFSVNIDSTVVTFYPGALLKTETSHTLFISKVIKDLQGYTMTGDVTATFTIKDTTPPPLPPAGNITASFPDADGYVTVTGTQGSAEATGVILIINDSTGEVVTVMPNPNGSFSGRIQAQLGDDIKLVSMDASGNQTLISYVVMKSADGKYLVSAKGGTVEGEGGLKLEIPEGALPGPTVIKITPVAQGQLPQDNPVPAETKFLAAVNIDTGGVKFRKEVQFSAPAPSDVTADAELFVAQPSVYTDGYGNSEKVYVIQDSAKLVDTAGVKRLSTACLPFDGVWGFGLFVFLMPQEQFTGSNGGSVILSGYTYRDMDGSGSFDATSDLPVANAPVRCPGAKNMLAYSNAEGHYATYVFYPQWGMRVNAGYGHKPADHVPGNREHQRLQRYLPCYPRADTEHQARRRELPAAGHDSSGNQHEHESGECAGRRPSERTVHSRHHPGRNEHRGADLGC